MLNVWIYIYIGVRRSRIPAANNSAGRIREKLIYEKQHYYGLYLYYIDYLPNG
jgi:hypothetical protein